MIEHVGTEDTRVFREVAQLGQELNSLGNQLLGSEQKSDVGIIFDWDNYWAVEYTSGPNQDLNYVEQIHQYYTYFYEKNISIDMIPIDADFSKYKVVVAPLLYMVKKGIAEALDKFVKTGGALVTTFMSGIVDQSDNVHLGGYPGPLRRMSGIWVEEIEALAPEQFNTISIKNGKDARSTLLADIIHLEGAESLANYSSNFYAGSPAVTKNQYGNGMVYYVGTMLDKDGLAAILDLVSQNSMIATNKISETSLEIMTRYNENGSYYFIINFQPESQIVPDKFNGKVDLLSNTTLSQQTVMKQYDVMIVKAENNE